MDSTVDLLGTHFSQALPKSLVHDVLYECPYSEVSVLGQRKGTYHVLQAQGLLGLRSEVIKM
jgi:hypothetical protein